MCCRTTRPFADSSRVNRRLFVCYRVGIASCQGPLFPSPSRGSATRPGSPYEPGAAATNRLDQRSYRRRYSVDLHLSHLVRTRRAPSTPPATQPWPEQHRNPCPDQRTAHPLPSDPQLSAVLIRNRAGHFWLVPTPQSVSSQRVVRAAGTGRPRLPPTRSAEDLVGWVTRNTPAAKTHATALETRLRSPSRQGPDRAARTDFVLRPAGRPGVRPACLPTAHLIRFAAHTRCEGGSKCSRTPTRRSTGGGAASSSLRAWNGRRSEARARTEARLVSVLTFERHLRTELRAREAEGRDGSGSSGACGG